MENNLNPIKVIIGDTDLSTFKTLKPLNNKFDVIFLSSDFAVNFIIEYEKIDLVILSNKISNLNNIIERTKNKKVKLFIFGKDIKYPIDLQEIEFLLEREQEKKNTEYKNKSNIIKKRFMKIWNGRKRFFEDIENTESKSKDKKNNCKLIIQNKKEKINKNEKEDILILKSQKVDPIEKGDAETKTGFNKQVIQKYKKQKEIVPTKTRIVKQKVIVLAKAKGGVGSTIIGIFLSSIFKEFLTLLIDLNFNEGGGDISYYLNIPKSPNILNFLKGYNKEALDKSIIQISDNLHILQPPPTFDQSKKIEIQDIYCIADIAKRRYHLIVIDLPNHLGDLWLGSVDLADLLVLVSDISIGSIGRLIRINNRYFYKGLEKLLVLNKHMTQDKFNLQKINLKSFFNLEHSIIIGENKTLREKTDFSDLIFSGIQDFDKLKNKFIELISS